MNKVYKGKGKHTVESLEEIIEHCQGIIHDLQVKLIEANKEAGDLYRVLIKIIDGTDTSKGNINSILEAREYVNNNDLYGKKQEAFDGLIRESERLGLYDNEGDE